MTLFARHQHTKSISLRCPHDSKPLHRTNKHPEYKSQLKSVKTDLSLVKVHKTERVSTCEVSKKSLKQVVREKSFKIWKHLYLHLFPCLMGALIEFICLPTVPCHEVSIPLYHK